MPIAGFVRFRAHQWGKQSALLTAVPATRVMAWRGAIEINPAREFPDVDTGSLEPNLPPLEGAKEVTATLEGPTSFNDLTYVYAAGVKGGETPTTSSTSRTWDFDPASLTADSFDYFTDEWGDDTTATDGIRAYGGVANSFTLSFDNDLGVWQTSLDMIYANADMAQAETGALTIDSAPIWMYGADTEVYLDSAAGSIGTTKLTDAIHGASVQVNNNLDQKRFANGSNSRFALAGFGRGEREITIELTVAKTTATMAERATLDDSPVPTKYIEIKTTSPSLAAAGIPYSNRMRFAAKLLTATDGEIGGNTTIVLTYRAVYDSTLTYASKWTLVNTLAAL
jgi:hypothetical protein